MSDDPGGGFSLKPCADCGRRVLSRWLPASPPDRPAHCESCNRARFGASLDAYGKDPSGLGAKLRHAPGLGGDINQVARRSWRGPAVTPSQKRTRSRES